MKSIAAILFFFISFSGAHAEGIEISCDTSPKEAKLSIPKPANKLVHIICSKYGHLIHPVKGWLWTRPGGFSPVFFPSQWAKTNPTEVNNNSYFKSITVHELNTDKSKNKWSVVGSMFDDKEQSDLKALEIIAVNNNDNTHTIYIFNNGWGYGCSPECKSTSSFLLIGQNKQKVSW